MELRRSWDSNLVFLSSRNKIKGVQGETRLGGQSDLLGSVQEM